MLRKYIQLFSAVCLLLLVFSNNIFAKENALIIGGKNGQWDFAFEKGITLGTGRFGYKCVELSTDELRVTETTDLLLSFEGNAQTDKSGNYKILSSTLLYTENAKMGKKSGLGRGMEGGMILQGNENTLFGGSGRTGSFTIEFWLYPSLCENGETIFSWRSSKSQGHSPLLQLISGTFASNHITWKFSNIFFDSNGTTENVIISTHNKIIPSKWAHHVLTYEEDTGLLEYKIDGRVEALQYVTTTGQEGSEILAAEIGSGNTIELVPFFTGCIDDFRIIRDVIKYESKYHTYNLTGGRFETMPLMTNGIGSVMTSISTVVQRPPQTDVEFFVRSGDNIFNWTNEFPKWTPVKDGEKIQGVKGRYFQVACNLYTDGLGTATPKVTEIIIHYQENRPPIPPYAVFAKAEEGAVELSWSPSADGSAKGYYIYYGNSPGEYLGRCAAEGSSPIDVKKNVSARISGLENGKIYYFAIAAYGDEDGNVVGALSKEVFARPIRIFEKD